MMADMDTSTQAASPAFNPEVVEIRGVFPDDAALQDAVGRLTRAGFDRAALSLPSAAQATGAENPDTEDDARQVRTLRASMAATAAAMVGAGVTVATGGAALVAGAMAVGMGAAAGGAVSAVHVAADTAQSGRRDAAGEAGMLVLAASAKTPEAEARARLAMEEAGAAAVERIVRK